MYQSSLLNTLQECQYIDNCTDFEGLDALLSENTPVPVYIGFDCTAPSLHVGSLIQIMALKHVQESGHKPIILIGGGTTRVGDPSGKDESRKLLDDDMIQHNMDSLKHVFSHYLEFESVYNAKTSKAFMVNNADWLLSLSYIDFLREYGRHFSINKMLSYESVKSRLEREQHLSFLEFNYMLLQAYDFIELYRRYNCRLQLGGSDQWGNIINGIDLHHKLRGEQTLYGLTTPLITTSDGKKMGKTAQGAIWLDESLLSPYDYWQFWRNTTDEDVGRFLRLFTDYSLDEIKQYEELEGSNINQAKIALANATTRLLHGKAAADAAEKTAIETFAEGKASDGLPEYKVLKDSLASGIPVFKLMVDAQLVKSGGEARRLIKGGGARLDDAKITNAEDLMTLEDFSDKDYVKLSAGKKRHILLKLTD